MFVERNTPSASHQPLAERMRPRTLEEFCGQEALLGSDAPLRRAIESDRLRSLILWGPPGTGKTTLARLIASRSQRHFLPLSAVLSGVKDIRDAIATARDTQKAYDKQTILFVDEVHRFNKAQQDALLPHVEDGTVTLIGATTENPSFELNSALLSRAPVFLLKSLDEMALRTILDRALADTERGLGTLHFPQKIPDEWLDNIARMANGDARRALTLLEQIATFLNSLPAPEKPIEFTSTLLEQALGAKTLRYDASGEEHYNTISAFIKSLRDSDPDAALYYLARMLEAGEDPLFIARRLTIFASEDVGNADPRALQIALNVRDAVDFVGLPEARISLAQAVTYLACASKSNASYVGIEGALKEVRLSGNLEVPLHLRNAPTPLLKRLHYGADYRYAHDQPGAFAGQQNLPEAIANRRFYEPKESGLEKQIRERLDFLRARRLGAVPRSKP